MGRITVHGDEIVTITLARHEVRNAFDRQMLEEIAKALQSSHIVEARAVIVASQGEHFCAGADMCWLQNARHLTDQKNREETALLAFVLHTLDKIPVPVCARIQGSVRGGGLGLVAACDSAIASHSASFALSEVRIGVAPACISPYVIPKIGISASRHYFLTGEQFSAARAYELGLVHQLTDDLDGAIALWSAAILAGAPQAQRAAKRLEDSVDGAALLAQLRVSEEAQEGINAFLQKRAPNWIKK